MVLSEYSTVLTSSRDAIWFERRTRIRGAQSRKKRRLSAEVIFEEGTNFQVGSVRGCLRTRDEEVTTLEDLGTDSQMGWV